MTKRPRSTAAEPMTLGNMRANGVRSIDVSCWQCHHEAALNAECRVMYGEAAFA
jgi:hypothetical protein